MNGGSKKQLLCLDFDGVLHSYSSGWKGARCIPDPPVPGAIEFLLTAAQVFIVAIHSSRARYWGGRRAMRQWLHRHIVEYEWRQVGEREYSGWTTRDIEERIEMDVRLFIDGVQFPLWKPPAHVTIDDRAITFRGVWPEIEELQRFVPWHKPVSFPDYCGLRDLRLARESTEHRRGEPLKWFLEDIRAGGGGD